MLPAILAHVGEAGATSGYFPPLHPIFVNFTAALVPISLLFDLLGVWRKSDRLLAAGWWTLLLAACITPLTVLFGWLWMPSMADMDHWQMPIHQWLGTALGAILIVVAAWRGWLYRHGRSPNWGYAAAGVVLLIALAAQGDLGGSMSFERGIVFSSGEHEATEGQQPGTPADEHGAGHDHDEK